MTAVTVFPAANRGRAFEEAVTQLARTCGWLVHHTRPALNSRGQWRSPLAGDKGWPDLALAHPSGQFILAELKAGTGRLEPAQKSWIQALTAAGVVVYLWRPADMPEIQRVLQRQVAA